LNLYFVVGEQLIMIPPGMHSVPLCFADAVDWLFLIRVCGAGFFNYQCTCEEGGKEDKSVLISGRPEPLTSPWHSTIHDWTNRLNFTFVANRHTAASTEINKESVDTEIGMVGSDWQ
jgi:hypothetical protein